MNHISLLGRLTENPVLRSVSDGISSASFTLAVNRSFKNKETGNFEADFIDIIAWRGTADFVGKYFTKGQLVAVEGRLQIESYTDKEGIRRRAAKVQASQVHFAESKEKQQAPQQQTQAPQQGTAQAPQSQGGYHQPDVASYYNQGQQGQGGYAVPMGGNSAPSGQYTIPNTQPAPSGYTVPPEEQDFPF
ncbi:MAG: single-stranded DNA-binding protein [Eubacteriales bacterium]